LFGIVCIGCAPEKEAEVILTEAEMVDILMVMYLSEERFAKIPIQYDSATKLSPRFREKVFEEAGVSHEVYKKSMEYYLGNPKQLERIYTALVDSLSLKEQGRPNENIQNDSPE